MSARGLPVSPLDHSRRRAPPVLVAQPTLRQPPISAAATNGYDPSGSGLTPSQIRHAYGLDQITGDGTGQTIAIIGAYHNPSIFSDLQTFDQQFGIPDPPSFRQVAQDGSLNYPPTAAQAGASTIWSEEAALDVQWSHALAPGANIVLIEASSNSYSDLLAGAVNWARNQPGVSVVSMSFGQTGGGEFSTETPYDQWFTTPNGHAGVTFVASTGDSGQPASYPAFSPNVVAVGGTDLSLSGGDYAGETGWGDSGGGYSLYEAKPSYQFNAVPSSTTRAAPDIALVADAAAVVYGGQWVSLGGTSLSAPLFAGMLAVADQLRVANGLTTLSGRDTLLKLYDAPASDFHDITQGNNGYSAGVGYDLVTGLGSPVANLLLPDLAGTAGTISGHAYSDNNGNGVFDAGDTPLAGARVYLDNNNNGTYDVSGTRAPSSGTVNVAIPDNDTFGAINALTVSGMGGPVTDVNVTLKINHSNDSQLSAFLIGPDGTEVQLFATADGLHGANFTNTTFDDSAAGSIKSGSAPFSSTYRPDQALSAFNGKSANGKWTLEVNDTIPGTTGTLASWSLSLTSGPEPSAWTAADGSYTLSGLAPASYTVRLNAPGTLPTGPASVPVNIHANSGTADFLQMPTAFTACGANDQFYLWQDADNYLIGKGTSADNPVYELPKTLVSALTFNLTSANSKLYVDFAAGAPIPQENVSINGGGLATSELIVLGAGAPATSLTMTDTQLNPGSGGVLAFTNLGTLSLWNVLVNFSGNLGTLQNLNVNAGTYFYWN